MSHGLNVAKTALQLVLGLTLNVAAYAPVEVCPLEDMRTNAMIKLPAVLLVGNDTDTEPTPDPSIAFDCTSPIPPPLPPLVLIVRFNALLAVNELVSVTRTVKLLVPVPVGVPEIAPVLDPSASPAGKAPGTDGPGVWSRAARGRQRGVVGRVLRAAAQRSRRDRDRRRRTHGQAERFRCSQRIGVRNLRGEVACPSSCWRARDYSCASRKRQSGRQGPGKDRPGIRRCAARGLLRCSVSAVRRAVGQ